MKRWALVVLALGAGALGACSTDRGDHGPAQPQVHALISADALVFATFDTDNDLRLTQAETDAGIAREFARADTNHDGSLQPIEFQNWSNAALGGMMLPPYRLDFDRNVDNVITADEFRTELQARAHAYDTDEDGVLTRAEFIRTVEPPRPQMRRFEGDPRMRRGGGMGG
ncbi:MAG: hypothetical protein ABUS48_02620 [Pseudomonadota bacterium]